MSLFENKKFGEEDISVRGELVAISYRATPLIIEIFKPNLLPVRKRYVWIEKKNKQSRFFIQLQEEEKVWSNREHSSFL